MPKFHKFSMFLWKINPSVTTSRATSLYKGGIQKREQVKLIPFITSLRVTRFCIAGSYLKYLLRSPSNALPSLLCAKGDFPARENVAKRQKVAASARGGCKADGGIVCLVDKIYVNSTLELPW